MMETCDLDQIVRFLKNELTPQQESALIAHCDQCEACCERMQDSAAAPDMWRRAQTFLSSDESLAGESLTATSLHFLAPTDDPRMLGRFAGHEIAGLIGCGGMGIVLKGFDPSLGRYAAIKVLAPHYATNGAARKRFAREAQAAAAVVHDNVLAIHAVGQFNGLPYLIMPYIRGESLQKRIDREGPLRLLELLRIAVQTVSGLAAAHAQGLIHRDIKPANVLLAEGVERVFITDFGLARAADDASLTRSGVIAGTPQYMSPEQARGEPLDLRSDLFSVGSLMHAMATGRAPFRAESPYGIVRRITDDTAQPVHFINAEMPPWLSTVISKLHAKSPQDRYGSAEEVASLLRQCLAHVQTPDTELPMSLQTATKKTHCVRRWAAVVITGVLLSAGISTAMLYGPLLTRNAAPSTTQLGQQRTGVAQENKAMPITEPLSVWNDDQPAELVDQSQQLLEALSTP